MSLHNWFLSQKNAYWLVSSDIHKKAIKQNHQLGFPDTLPLFYGESFKQVMPYSPWLIPYHSELNHLDNDIFNQGLALVSHISMWEVMEHLRSLLYAALDGEEVLFRFYDPQVILPMLSTFAHDEVNAFLGNIQQLAGVQDESLKLYRNTSQLDYQPHSATWWKILPQHLEPLYNVKMHAKAIVHRLWEKLPHQIDKLVEPSAFFEQTLQQAIENGATPDKAENMALIQFSKQTRMQYTELSQALLLTRDETEELQKIDKEWISWDL